MLTYPWKCTVLHCNHLGNTWKPLVLMTWHFDYCPSASEGDIQSVSSSAPVVSRCFPGGYNVKLYISRGRLAWWLLAFCTVIVFYAGSDVTQGSEINWLHSLIFIVLFHDELLFSLRNIICTYSNKSTQIFRAQISDKAVHEPNIAQIRDSRFGEPARLHWFFPSSTINQISLSVWSVCSSWFLCIVGTLFRETSSINKL